MAALPDDFHINRILMATLLAAGLSLVGGAVIGFAYGMHFHNLKNGSVDFSTCNQYTVLNASHVVTACGDTIQYNWKATFKPVKIK